MINVDSFEKAKGWADNYVEAFKEIVQEPNINPYLQASENDQVKIDVGSRMDDMSLGVDLVGTADGKWTFGTRLRNGKYADRYPYEFTLRSGTPKGTPELQKILDVNLGYVKTMLYAMAQPEASETEDAELRKWRLKHPYEIDKWFLLDLSAFRHHAHSEYHGINQITVDGMWDNQIYNGDGTSFIPFKMADFPRYPCILLAHGVGRRFDDNPGRRLAKGSDIIPPHLVGEYKPGFAGALLDLPWENNTNGSGKKTLKKKLENG